MLPEDAYKVTELTKGVVFCFLGHLEGMRKIT